jgi:hypothetical protein
LILALQASVLQPGDKVILPSFTFMAIAQAVLYANAIPLFAEINDDLTLSTEDLERLLSQHDDVAAVLPVHTFGLPARTDEIQAVVDRAGQTRSKPISVLYDAAHAFGSGRGNRRIGTFSESEIFSLRVAFEPVPLGVKQGGDMGRGSGLIELALGDQLRLDRAVSGNGLWQEVQIPLCDDPPLVRLVQEVFDLMIVCHLALCSPGDGDRHLARAARAERCFRRG